MTVTFPHTTRAIDAYPEPEHDPAICYICETDPSIAPGEMCADCAASWDRHVAEQTCPVCHGSGRIADGDDVDYCDEPGCSAWQDQEPDGVDWEDEYHPGTHYAPYVLPDLLPRGTAQVA